jgi:hypothetical protein
MNIDPQAIARSAASKLETLASLRGVKAVITFDGAQYIANGEVCGPSVHGVLEWLAKQPRVKP